MIDKIVIGSRKSALALKQTNIVIEEIHRHNRMLNIKIKTIITKGDRNLEVSLSKIGGKGLFVKELETSLLSGEIDLAVHSMKDMPSEVTAGTIIAAIMTRENPCDVLVSNKYRNLKDLPIDSIIGTSSLRRSAQLLSMRPDLFIKPVRGNVNTRLSKLEKGEFDAIILAAAGLNRLGLTDIITQEFSMEDFLPAVGQGALALQCRSDNSELLQILHELDDNDTSQAIKAEREFMSFFGGGCHLPIAAYAETRENKMYLQGLVGSPDGKKIIRGSLLGSNNIGLKLAKDLVNRGAKKILAEVALKGLI